MKTVVCTLPDVIWILMCIQIPILVSDEFTGDLSKITEGDWFWLSSSSPYCILNVSIFGCQKCPRRGLPDPPWRSSDRVLFPRMSWRKLFHSGFFKSKHKMVSNNSIYHLLMVWVFNLEEIIHGCRNSRSSIFELTFLFLFGRPWFKETKSNWKKKSKIGNRALYFGTAYNTLSFLTSRLSVKNTFHSFGMSRFQWINTFFDK